MTPESSYIRAQAQLHHAYLLGLQLMVSANKEAAVVGEWMFKLFRRQHLEKFLSSFEKLGLTKLPHAVACAQYHVLSNNIGGVGVEYMFENDRKAWVRFRYPRWMYAGPTLCGIPIEVSRGFLEGWYAHNGVSLKNSRLGFVCVSEDMTGEFGFCGYFKEFDAELADHERLQFARGELPPIFDASLQPVLPAAQWNEERLAKANRNYALDFFRNAIVALVDTLGQSETEALAGRAARLIGLQYLQEMLEITGSKDGDLADAADYLERMMLGMDDRMSTTHSTGAPLIELKQEDPRIVRGLTGRDRLVVLNCWMQLWAGAMSSYRAMKSLDWELKPDSIQWRLTELQR
ncbi:MAG: hypothetical protein O2971_17450 [Proteobacteria bacterium]|nr:hypothetical protein [Pseudomonadota bacterium]